MPSIQFMVRVKYKDTNPHKIPRIITAGMRSIRKGSSMWNSNIACVPVRIYDTVAAVTHEMSKGTNEPIEKPVNPVNHEDRLIMAVNKWAFGHKDSSVVATRGGFEGIFGENTEIKY